MKGLIIISTLIAFSCSFAQDLPDLEIKEIHEPEWGDNKTIFKITVKNKGKIVSQPCHMRVWDVDITLDEAKKLKVDKKHYWIFEENEYRAEDDGLKVDYDQDWELNFDVPIIRAGEEKTFTLSLNDIWVYDSNCEIGATIDIHNSVEEKNEKNNTKYFFAGG